MYKQHTVGVVVPAYNEEGLVGDVLETMPAIVDRVYVFDDCSSDGTWAEIQRARARLNASRSSHTDDGREEFVIAERHEENQGRGRCVKEGYRRALADGLDVVAVVDGDGQMDPDELHRILDPVVDGRADYAKGTRLKNRGDTNGMSRWRLFGNVVLSFLTNLSSGYWGLVDSQNGYTAISRQVLCELPIEKLYDRYGFLNDILTELNVHGFTIAEVPHPAVYGDEESNIRYTTFVPFVSLLLLWNFLYRIQKRYLVRNFHPVVLCYTVGITGLMLGAVGGIIGLLTQTPAVSPVTVPAAGGFGILLFLLAIVLDIQQNSRLTYQSEPHPEPNRQRQ